MKIWADGSTTRVCCILEGSEPVIVELSDTVTVNEGEYLAVIYAFILLARDAYYKKPTIEILSDSQLIVRQLNNEYAIKAPNLQVYAEVAKWLAAGWNVTFVWLPREENPAGKILECKVKR